MSKVFIPHVPSRFDKVTRSWIPTVEIALASKFGEIVTMLPPDAARAAINPCVTAMREQMAGFTAEDWVVAVGDPSLIGAACVIATSKTRGLLRLLKWDRMLGDYIPIEVKL